MEREPVDPKEEEKNCTAKEVSGISSSQSMTGGSSSCVFKVPTRMPFLPWNRALPWPWTCVAAHVEARDQTMSTSTSGHATCVILNLDVMEGRPKAAQLLRSCSSMHIHLKKKEVCIPKVEIPLSSKMTV